MPKERMLRVHVPEHKSHSKSGKVETVEAHNYMTPDKGAPGRTPEEDQWFSAHGELHGWAASQGAGTRHRHLRTSVKEEGYLKTFQKIHGLGNVTAVPHVREATKADEKWLRETYR